MELSDPNIYEEIQKDNLISLLKKQGELNKSKQSLEEKCLILLEKIEIMSDD